MNKSVIRYVFNKVMEVVLTLLIVTLLSFLLMRLSPVDPATAYVKRNTPIVTEEQIQEARLKLGLDKPLLIQYITWVGNAVHFDYGISLHSGYPVIDEIKKAVPVTLSVILLASIIMSAGIIIFGFLNYFARDKAARYLLKILCIGAISIPPFYLATVYIDIFAIKLKLMSVAGNTGFARYFPAAICLSVLGIALYSQLLAKRLEIEMNEDYVFYARCRGLSEMRILFFHALPHAVAYIIPSYFQILGLFMAGAAVIESVFSLPGIGHLIIDSVVQRDSPMIHAEVLVLAAFFVAFNIISDIFNRIIQKDKTDRESEFV